MDTKDFLNKDIFTLPWDTSYVLMVLDIASLYTSIEHTKGLKAVSYFLNKRQLCFCRHSNMLLELAEFCLRNNIFLFDGVYYRQIAGTVMGTCFAPSYANLFVGWWEERLPRSCTIGEQRGKVISWYRYIDDLFIVWQGSVETANAYITALNDNNMNLHFSGTVSPVAVDYLDLRVFVADNKLQTALYRKPTAGNSTSTFSSSHPKKLVESIPYGELLRLKRNSTQPSDFDRAAIESMARFSQRGYGQELLVKTYEKVKRIPRNELLKPKIISLQNDINKFRLVTSYSAEANYLKYMLRKNWHILKTDGIIGKDIPQYPLVTFRRARSFRDSLVTSHFSRQTRPEGTLKEMKGFFPCGRCKACRNSKRVLHYNIPETNIRKQINKFITCGTTHVVYCLQCPCGLNYIGSTIHPLKIRVLEHLRAIEKNDVQYPVARHFAEIHSSSRNLLQFYGLDTIQAHERGGDRIRQLRRLESRYIIDLQTKTPKGMNGGEELATHLGL